MVIVGIVDMMLKLFGVILVGYEKIGSGYCMVVVCGGIVDVCLVVEFGVKIVEKFG